MAPVVLTLVVTAAFLLTFYFSSTAEADEERMANRVDSLSVADVTVERSPVVSQVVAQVSPQVAAPMQRASEVSAAVANAEVAASAPAVWATEEPSGPAKIEMRNDGLAALPGMAPTVHAVSAQRAADSAAELVGSAPSSAVAQSGQAAPTEPSTSPAGLPASTATSTTTATATARSNSSSNAMSHDHAHATTTAAKPAAPRSVAASKPREATARPKAQGTAPRSNAKGAAAQRDATDPDAELVAAIMARSSGDPVTGSGIERGSSIAALVRDCNALPDSGSALACLRRICDGYWGKAQACPKSMAPQAAAEANNTPTGTAH